MFVLINAPLPTPIPPPPPPDFRETPVTRHLPACLLFPHRLPPSGTNSLQSVAGSLSRWLRRGCWTLAAATDGIKSACVCVRSTVIKCKLRGNIFLPLHRELFSFGRCCAREVRSRVGLRGQGGIGGGQAGVSWLARSRCKPQVTSEDFVR